MLKKFLLFFVFTPHFSIAADNFKPSISLFGDEKYPPNFKYFEYANEKAPKNGVLKLGVEGTFNSLNPFILKGLAASGIDYVYDSLMQSSDDEISSYYPLIADFVALADDKYSISFRINKKAKWHDGNKIKADDVIFTFNILRQEAHPSFKIAYQDVDKAIKINDYEVKFLFKTNKNKDLPMLLASMKILPKHYYKNRKFDEANLDKPLGSGPYSIKFVDQGKTIIYQREKNYWAKDLPVNVGRYNFDEIKFDYYRDANVLIEAFKAGNFDIRQENVARNWANSYNIDKVQNGEIIKREVPYNLPSSIQTFILNLRREKFQDKEFRKAMTYAFNFEWLKKHIFYGSYSRTSSYFENSDFAYKNFKLPISDENNFGRKNLIIAKKILDDAGYKVNNGRLISPYTKKPISIEFLISSQNFEMIIAPFVKNLQKLGIDAKMKFIEENQYEARLRNFDYDVIVGVFGQNSPPSSELVRYFHSKQADIKGSQNYLGLKNAQIDDLVEKISKAQNKQELQFLCQKFDKIMLENYYTILQWHNDSYRILYKNDLKMPQKLPKYGLGVDFWWKE